MPKVTCPRSLIACLLNEKPDEILRRITDAIKKSGCRWWWLHPQKEDPLIFDLHHLALWQGQINLKALHRSENAPRLLQTLRLGGLEGWQLPEAAALRDLVTNGFPLQKGEKQRLENCRYFLTRDRAIDLDTFQSHPEGRLLVTRPFPTAMDLSVVVKECLQRGWWFEAHKLKTLVPDLMKNLRNEYLEVLSFVPEKSKQISTTVLFDVLQQLDAQSLPLPVLPIEQLTDSTRGLWELHTERLPASEMMTFEVSTPLRARDPAADIQPGYVAIDFGSSNTVIAYRERGQDRLLRVGVSDYRLPIESVHYENPSVIEFVDLVRFLPIWQRIAYRPPIRWDHIKVSHAANEDFLGHQSDALVVRSVLFRLKQWALRDAQNLSLCVTDQRNGYEQAIAPLPSYNLEAGEILTVSEQDGFNPIELYAYCLGLAINWRQRGIFLHYCLTFPVTYPKAVKDKVVASFHRGLQRSLPASLAYHKAVFSQFSVEERASEPVAYAVAAFETLKITPTSTGVAYAVFDFGGGTADFDYGRYRLADDDEAEAGYEIVIEHFGAAGDRFLGAENLLENLAYRVFQTPVNLEVCRRQQITFQKPFDADNFPGSEAFLERTQASLTNMVLLANALRPLWQSPDDLLSETLSVRLMNREGIPQLCTLTLPVAALRTYLEERLEKGVQSFYLGLHTAFEDHGTYPETVQILLAGNGSRSPMVGTLFGLYDSPNAHEMATRMQTFRTTLFADWPTQFTVHAPRVADEQNPYQATAKTGVALGLLRLCPGEPIKIINAAQRQKIGKFQYFVGKIVRKKFVPALSPRTPRETWVELGTPREGVFYLIYTPSPLAVTGEIPHNDPDLTTLSLRFKMTSDEQRVFVRSIEPTVIETCISTRAQIHEPVNRLFLQRHELRRDT